MKAREKEQERKLWHHSSQQNNIYGPYIAGILASCKDAFKNTLYLGLGWELDRKNFSGSEVNVDSESALWNVIWLRYLTGTKFSSNFPCL